MAGMTDSAFRRLVKRQGACGLVVSEMVSSEALVRGIGRSLECLEFTDEGRPVAIQIFGGDPARMAEAARVVESRGADIVDVNMGCPVPKIAKHNAGCSLMRSPASPPSSLVKAVKSGHREMRCRLEREPERARLAHGQSGCASAVAVNRTAAQAYRRFADWDLIARVASGRIGVWLRGSCRPNRSRAPARYPSPACSWARHSRNPGCSRRQRISWPAGRARVTSGIALPAR
jgi:tRNA-dihydrouridine synthase B